MSQAAVKIYNLSVYYGTTPALVNVSFEVAEGEFLGIIGPNGGGKTTLLRAVLGLTPFQSGNIELFGKKVGKSRKLIGYVPQIASMDKRFPITVLEVVLSGRLKQGLSPFFKFNDSDKELSYDALRKVGIEHLAKRQISELSGGEFQRMLIARALTVGPKMLILDEPTASVDIASKEQIAELLGELNKEMTIMLVTHDLLSVTSQVNKLACLSGKLVYHGKPELTEKVMSNLYGCPVDLLSHEGTYQGFNVHQEVQHIDCCNL